MMMVAQVSWMGGNMAEQTQPERDWMAEARMACPGFTTLDALEHDRAVVAAGKAPARLTVAAAYVAAVGVQTADKAAKGPGKRRPQKAGREQRARDLLERALVRECGALFAEAQRRGGLWSEAACGGVSNLDAVLVERLNGLGVTAERVADVWHHARAMWSWGEAHRAKRWALPLPLFPDDAEEVQVDLVGQVLPDTPEVLAPWVLRCAVAPAVQPSAVTGEGDVVQVLVTPLPASATLPLTPTMAEVMRGEGREREAMLLVAMHGWPATAEVGPMFDRAMAQARALADAIGAAAQKAKLADWVKFPAEGGLPVLCRPVALAMALWRAVVQAEWDKGERLRKAQPVAAGPMAVVQKFAAGRGNPALVEPLLGDVRMMRAGAVMPAAELLAACERGEIGAQSAASQAAITWLTTVVRAGAREGGTYLVAGGWVAVAREVLGLEEPTPKQVEAVREAMQSWQFCQVRQSWRGGQWDGFVVGLTEYREADERRRMVGVTPGPVLHFFEVPKASALPPGQREAAKPVPPVPLLMKPKLVLGNRLAAAEAALPDALVRLFYRERSTYARGVLVTEAVLAEVLAEFGLAPAHAPKVLAEFLTASEEARVRGGATVQPLFREVAPERWQLNPERWMAGHHWLLQAAELTVKRSGKRAHKGDPKGAL